MTARPPLPPFTQETAVQKVDLLFDPAVRDPVGPVKTGHPRDNQQSS
jgi:nuclear transport factor 2 (NTF2) superfamily protein